MPSVSQRRPTQGTQGGALQHPRPAAWDVHFPHVEYTAEDMRAVLIRELQAHFATEAGWQLLSQLQVSSERRCILKLDFTQLNPHIRSGDLEQALLHQPGEALSCLAAAAYQVLCVINPQRVAELMGSGPIDRQVAVRLVNHPSAVMHIKDIRSSCIGKLVTVNGTVVRGSGISPLVTAMGFACGSCGKETHAAFPDGVFNPPPKCGTPGCRGKTLVANRSSAKSVDWRRLRLQEETGKAQEEEGRVPRTIEVEVTQDLVDSAAVGDIVRVLGFVKVLNADAAAGGRKKDKQSLFLLYVDAVSVEVVKGSNSQQPAPAGQSGADATGSSVPGSIGFRLKDLQFIVAFSERYAGRQLQHLLHAVCPSIYGQELVKMGILLALMGGVPKGGDSSGKVSLRGDIHMLVVGDPGLGKSQLLQAAAAAASRGVYICGHTSTSAGLTVAVVRDGTAGDFGLEAGALVLADRGLCCLDEFDKMTADHQALLIAMEQGEVSVAKAGMVATLPARTTVLAAANPKNGHYCRSATVLENLNMSEPLLSRFDLVFVLLDASDEQRDKHLSEHVMALHSGHADRARSAQQALLEYRPVRLLTGPSAGGGPPPRPPLVERLQLLPEDTHEPLPTQLLQRYIAYARQYCRPVMSDEAKALLQEHYLTQRKNSMLLDGTPVTARQLESLIRMSEARARCDLSTVVTQEHAEDVIDLMKEIATDRVLEENGGFQDFRAATGRGSKQAEMKRFLGALERQAAVKGDAAFTVSDMYSIADRIELQLEVAPLIDDLREAGELLKKGPQMYEAAAARAQLARAAARAAQHL